MQTLLTFVLIAAGSVWLSFFILPEFINPQVVSYLSYPVLFITTGLWLLSMAKLYHRQPDLKAFIPKRKIAWLVILSVTGFHLLVEPFAFKIVLDEVILSTSAEIMHFTRLSGIAFWGNDYKGGYEFINIMLDKRPFFFPFLISLVHDLTGFRYQNVFILNGLLTLILMTTTYSLGRTFSSHRGGILAVLMTLTLPLLSIMATSGHFEILNLVMLSITLIFSIIYIRNPVRESLNPLVLTLLLLAQVRYENVIYILPFGVLILLGWKKAHRIILPWQVMIAPLLLLVSALHYYFIFNGDRVFFQTGPNAREQTFAISYAAENLNSALNFLFSTGFSQPNSFLISILGISSLLFFLGYCWKRSDRCTRKDPKPTVLFVFMMAIGCLMGVITFFNYGLWDQYITSRLSLPVHLLFLLLIPFTAIRFGRPFLVFTLIIGLFVSFIKMNFLPDVGARTAAVQLSVAIVGMTGIWFWIWKSKTMIIDGLLIITGVFLLTISLPVSHSRQFAYNYQNDRIIEKELSFLEQKSGKEKILWVSSAPYTAFLTKTNCVPPSVLNADPQLAKNHMDNLHYDSIYLSRVLVKDQNGNFELMEPIRDFLDPEVFEIERVELLNLGFERRLEISRINNIRNIPETPHEKAPQKASTVEGNPTPELHD